MGNVKGEKNPSIKNIRFLLQWSAVCLGTRSHRAEQRLIASCSYSNCYIGTQDIVFVRSSGAYLVYINKNRGIFLVTYCGHLERSNSDIKFLRDKVDGYDLICSLAINLYAFKKRLVPKSQRLRVVY